MQPSQPASGAAPAPADPMQSLVAHLDDVMAQAEIAANAERDLDAETPTAPSARQEAPPEDEGDEDGDLEDSEPEDDSQDEDEGVADEREGEPPAEGEPKPTEQAQPKYSRRDAARFATELESARKKLDETSAQLTQHQGELAHFRHSDQAVRAQLMEHSGYTKEANGRFRYENLSEKVLKGTASQEEAEEVSRMTQWHEFAGPIFRAAEEMVLGTFSVNWQSLKDLDGVGDKGLQALNGAPNSIEASKQLHALAFAAGEAKAKGTYESQIQKLRAELKSVKTRQLANGPQPATANGAAVPGKGGFLSRAIDPKTGLTNPDFDREVASGKWVGVDLSQA